MKCPQCENLNTDGSFDSKVLDTQTSRDGHVLRRRRQCLKCGHRWSTAELEVQFAGKGRENTREAILRHSLMPSIAAYLADKVDQITNDLQSLKLNLLPPTQRKTNVRD